MPAEQQTPKNMYESLRLSAGGGLNSTMEKVDQADKTATIAIGIGGTGVDALRMFKKTVYERVKQDNFEKRDTEVPQYDRIKFMAIDSDQSGKKNDLPHLDFGDEFFYLGVSDIIAELADKAALNAKPHLDWFNKQVNMTDASNGAGGIRQVGKYLLSKKANQLYNSFTSMIRSSITGLGENFNLNIYIMAGLGGGTGSGCFVDVCYIMQQALADTGYAGSANVLGFFFLPDVNLSNPQFPQDGPNVTLVKVNGYAALKELDYLMDIPNNGDVYSQQYSESFGTSNLAVPPVKLCHLMSTTAINGAVLEDGYNYVMNVVAEYALNFVVKVDNTGEKDDKSSLTMKGHVANLKAVQDVIYKGHGANYVYNILGASCATVPYKQIGTYLAIKFFDSIKYISKVRPTKEDVKKFCQNVGFQTWELENKVRAGASALTLNSDRFDTQALKAVSVGQIHMSLGEFCDNWKNAYAGRRTANIRTLATGLDSYKVTNAPESITGKIYKELIACINNPALGPYFAAYMIERSQNHTIASELVGIREEVKGKRDDAQGQLSFRRTSMDEAQAEFRSATLFVEKKKKEYLHQVELYYRCMVDIETYDAFLRMLDEVKEQLVNLEEQYFKKYTGIVDKLIKTFEDNAEYFETHGMGAELYTWNVVDIDSIKDQLDEVVSQYIQKNEAGIFVAPYLVNKFNTMMLDNHDKWKDETETKIAELIGSFIRTEFMTAMSKTMKQYLQEKYNSTGADLIKDIADKVIKSGLVDKGTPVFHVDPLYDINDKKTHGEYIVLSIPYDEADFNLAAKQFQNTHNLRMQIKRTVLTDRIFMLEFYSGIPMYAYKDLMDYETTYQSIVTPGRHMYECEQKDWRNLPSPIPVMYISTNYARPNQEEVDNILKLYDEAKGAGIIVEDTINGYAKVKTSPDLELGAIMGAGWDRNVETITSTIKALMTYRDTYDTRLAEFATLSAYQDFDKSIRDNFVRKPVIYKAVSDEVAKYQKMCDSITQAESARDKVGGQMAVRADFIRALLHSVIVKARSNYKYAYEKRGEVEDIILTSETPLYESIPVYRAYVNYKALNADILEQINEKAQKAANNVTDEMYTAVESFREFYKGVFKDYKMEATSGKFENKDEIVEFLDELYDSIERFIVNNK